MKKPQDKPQYHLTDQSGKTMFVGPLWHIKKRLKMLFGTGPTGYLLRQATRQGYQINEVAAPANRGYNKDMEELKKKLSDIPTLPGVYKFYNQAGEIIYVGKAKNLKNRVSQYFGHDTRPQIPFLMADAINLDYTVVESELEALFLENTLIKQYLPQYNIKLRDDKNYAFIKIDYETQIPQIGYARKVEPGKAKYFGPYSSTYKIRQTLDFARRIFPYCANTEVGKRPCFYYHLHRCPGICIGQISLEEYQQQINRITLFLSGQTAPIKKELKREMQSAARNKQFEKAARLRDQLRALEVLDEKQITMFPRRVDWDFISVHKQFGTACVNLFKVREGRLIDKENFIFEDGVTARLKDETIPSPPGDGEDVPQGQERSKENLSRPVPEAVQGTLSMNWREENSARSIIEAFLETYYTDATDVPREIYSELPVRNDSLIQDLLRAKEGHKVGISIPTRGKKLQLVNLGRTNAQEYLRKWLRDQASDIDYIKQTLEELKTLLNLPTLPRRIEGYDISNIQGTNPVGSMVVSKDGQPAKSEYRKFKITGKQTPDDFAMMREMLSRRLTRITPSVIPSEEGIQNSEIDFGSPSQTGGIRNDKQSSVDAWPTPDLIVIDGGKGQLSVAVEVLKEKGLQIPVIGLAKRIEEIFLPGNPEPIILPHSNPILQLLQRLRDEAHRFGITFHRKLRSKQAVRSALDTIPGVGPKTKKILKQKFGTVAQIKAASLEQLANIVGQNKAEILKKHL